MKTLCKTLIILALSLGCMHSCDKDHSYADDRTPEISAAAIAGRWQMISWNGEELTGRYSYIVLDASERTFINYHNFDSAYPRVSTGEFRLKYDIMEEVNIISGFYDYASGYWNRDYVVTLDRNTMTWTAYDDATDVMVFERCQAIPEDVIP